MEPIRFVFLLERFAVLFKILSTHCGLIYGWPLSSDLVVLRPQYMHCMYIKCITWPCYNVCTKNPRMIIESSLAFLSYKSYTDTGLTATSPRRVIETK